MKVTFYVQEEKGNEQCDQYFFKNLTLQSITICASREIIKNNINPFMYPNSL